MTPELKERAARKIAAIKMGLSNDGERLPDDLWKQAMPLVEAVVAMSASEPAPASAPSCCGEQRNTYDHALNEWADHATNCQQWLKNVRDGIVSIDAALISIVAEYAEVLAVSRAATAPRSGESDGRYKGDGNKPMQKEDYDGSCQ